MSRIDPKATPELRNYGAHLRAARQKRHLRITQLAVITGIPAPQLSLIETGKRWPTLAQSVHLARALALPLQWFLTGTVEPPTRLRDLILELRHWGNGQLLAPTATVPGAFRPLELTLVLAVQAPSPEPRILEAIPALLALNDWDPAVLVSQAKRHHPRVAVRLAWLADIALTLQRTRSWSVDAARVLKLSDLTHLVERPDRKALPDDLGVPAQGKLHPVWRRWNVSYAGDIESFWDCARTLTSTVDASFDD